MTEDDKLEGTGEPTADDIRRAFNLDAPKNESAASEEDATTAELDPPEITFEMVAAALGDAYKAKPSDGRSRPSIIPAEVIAQAEGRALPVPYKACARGQPVPPVRERNPVMSLGVVYNELEALDHMTGQREDWLIRNRHLLPEGGGIVRQHLMSYEVYRHTVKNRSKFVKELERQRFSRLPYLDERYKPHIWQATFSPAQIHFLDNPASMHHTEDAAGFKFYLQQRHGGSVAAVLAKAPRPVSYPEISRKKHTLVVGPSDWGKSELFKALLYHYVEDGSSAVVVLDPGGDLVKQVSRWPELIREDRMRIIQPGLDLERFKGYTVGFNPLNGRGLCIEDRKFIAADWALTLGTLTKDLSANMQLLISMCVQVLLAFPGGANLDDLSRLLAPRPKAPRGSQEKLLPPKDQRTRELLSFAQNFMQVPRVARFFLNNFDDDSIEQTRHSLWRRIELLLSYSYFEGMLTGEPTFDLEDEINKRRFILVDLSRFKKPADRVMGRLFIAQVAAIGRRRENNPMHNRTPTHVFVDEASTMISAEMLEVMKEMRKFGIYMTLGQQVGGDAMTPDQKAILRTNTGCKLVAPLSAANEWLDHGSNDELPEINPGQFLVDWPQPRGMPSLPIHQLNVRSDLKDYAHCVPDWEWDEHLWEITGPGGYYRSAELPEESGLELPPDDDPGPPPPRPTRRKPPLGDRQPGTPGNVPPELHRFVSKTGREGDW